MASSFQEFFKADRIQRRVEKLIIQTDWELGYFNDDARRGDGGLERPSNVIDLIFPSTSYLTRRPLINKYKGNLVAASVIGPDDPLPQKTGKSQVNEERLTRVFLGAQRVWTNEDYEDLRNLELYSGQGPENQATANQIEKDFIGSAEGLTRGLDIKTLALLFQAATKGSFTYTDPMTAVAVEMTFTDTVAAQLPAAPGTLWNNTAATGLAQLETLAKAHRATHGVFPRYLLMHYTELVDLAEQTATLAQVGAEIGGDSSNNANIYLPTTYNRNTYMLSPGRLQEAIAARTGGAEVVIFDAKYTEEDKDGNHTDQYFLPQGYIMFANENMGEKARLPFKENGWQPGVVTRTNEIIPNALPLQERTAAMTAVVPFIPDGRDICAQQVGATA